MLAVLSREEEEEAAAALQAETLDGENKAFMLMFSRAFRPFKPSLDGVKGQCGHFFCVCSPTPK